MAGIHFIKGLKLTIEFYIPRRIDKMLTHGGFTSIFCMNMNLATNETIIYKRICGRGGFGWKRKKLLISQMN